MEAKEKWVKETLESIDHIGQAQSNPFIYDKIMHRMQTEKSVHIQPVAIRWSLAFGLVLIGLNLFTLLNYNKTKQSPTNSESSFTTEYFSYINNF